LLKSRLRQKNPDRNFSEKMRARRLGRRVRMEEIGQAAQGHARQIMAFAVPDRTWRRIGQL
jgi:hypothetical protein